MTFSDHAACNWPRQFDHCPMSPWSGPPKDLEVFCCWVICLISLDHKKESISITVFKEVMFGKLSLDPFKISMDLFMLETFFFASASSHGVI